MIDESSLSAPPQSVLAVRLNIIGRNRRHPQNSPIFDDGILERVRVASEILERTSHHEKGPVMTGLGVNRYTVLHAAATFASTHPNQPLACNDSLCWLSSRQFQLLD